MITLYDLKTEYLHMPNAVDKLSPRLSWKISSDSNAAVQTDYRIVALSDGELIWDSGKVNSNENRVCYAGKKLISRQSVSWRVEVTCIDGSGETMSASSNDVCFVVGLLDKSDWLAKWIEPEDVVDKTTFKPAPILRKTFSVEKTVKSARIYQTAHGLYESYFNGVNSTEDKFAPGLTSYYYRIQYQTYDVTSLMTKGQNVWAVRLADGWWRGTTGGTVTNNFGFKLAYLGQLEIEYVDGTKEVIVTDESFLTSYGGLLASDMMMGDIYDACREPDNWKTSNFDDSEWKKVHYGTEYTDSELIASSGVPVREKERFYCKEFVDNNGKRILDFAQNLAGYCEFTFRNTKQGQKIVLTFGEDIKDGCFSQDNIRATSLSVPYFQQITYICRGEKTETYKPFSCVFGYRYVCVEGYAHPFEKGDAVSIAVYSDMEEAGGFDCSNPLLNRLAKNCMWSEKSNFLDVAVDCPTRERNAWTGDAQVFCRASANLMNVYPFFEKWLIDQKIEQYNSGKLGITFPSTSSVHNPKSLIEIQKTNPLYALAGPMGDGNISEDSVGWGDSSVWIPYIMYLCYGDKQILKNQYNTAKRWVDYMLSCAKEHNPLYSKLPQYHNYTDGILDAEYIYDTRMHFGDWCEPIPKEFSKIPEGVDVSDVKIQSKDDLLRLVAQLGKPRVATAYMRRSTLNLSDIAKVLGKYDDANKYYVISEKIKTVYDKYFISDLGDTEKWHQADYVRILAMDLCEKTKRQQLADKLAKSIAENDFKLNTGFLSTPFLLPVLADTGYADVAFKILEQTEAPNWLYAVKLGATTILENWLGMDTHEESFNHYAYGAVCEFLFAYIGGIRPIWTKPGYQEFVLKPIYGGTLTYANVNFNSPYGTIESEWHFEGENIVYNCTVPVNTTAHLTLFDGSTRVLRSGRYSFTVKR